MQHKTAMISRIMITTTMTHMTTMIPVSKLSYKHSIVALFYPKNIEILKNICLSVERCSFYKDTFSCELGI